MIRRTHLILVLSVLPVFACNRDRPQSTKDPLAKDTALANDLRHAAVDTSAYGDAAEVAVADRPDTALQYPALPVRMRTVAVPRRSGSPAVAPQVAIAQPRPRPAPSASATAAPSAPATPTPSAPATPAASACESADAADQRHCLMGHLAQSDVGLDRTYQALIAALRRQASAVPGEREPETVRQLREAQRAWLVYRDTECRRTNRGKEGPLWAPMRAACLGEFSGRREEELAGALATVNAR